MALLTRVARLLRADLHGVLDRIEEPETLLRQSIREMEEALGHERTRAGRLERERERLAARAGELARALGATEPELDMCFESGNDALARELVRRRLETERLAEVLDRRRAGIERELADLGTRRRENEARLEAMRQRAEVLAEPAAAPRAAEAEPGVAVSAAEVEVAFLREQRKRRPS